MDWVISSVGHKTSPENVRFSQRNSLQKCLNLQEFAGLKQVTDTAGLMNIHHAWYGEWGYSLFISIPWWYEGWCYVFQHGHFEINNMKLLADIGDSCISTASELSTVYPSSASNDPSRVLDEFPPRCQVLPPCRAENSDSGNMDCHLAGRWGATGTPNSYQFLMAGGTYQKPRAAKLVPSTRGLHPWTFSMEPKHMMIWKMILLFKGVIFQVPCFVAGQLWCLGGPPEVIWSWCFDVIVNCQRHWWWWSLKRMRIPDAILKNPWLDIDLWQLEGCH